MKLRPLGPGAPAVTAVSYGGMHLSIQERPPEADSLRVLSAVLDAGVSLIDTADAYCLDEREVGHNERLIARAIRASGRGAGRPACRSRAARSRRSRRARGGFRP